MSNPNGPNDVPDVEPKEIPDDYSYEDEEGEPVGSCDQCGVNLYEWNDPELCDQCEFQREQAN